MQQFIIEDEVGVRLDLFLRRKSFNMPYFLLAKNFKNNKIKVCGTKVPLSYRLKKGDVVTVFFEAVKPELCVVYKDEALLIINKPAGLATICAGEFSAEKLVLEIYPTASAVHRLDTGTCGLLMFALTDKAKVYIEGLQQKGVIKKEYHALVANTPKKSSGRLVHYLMKNSKTSTVYIFDTKTNPFAKRCELYFDTVKSTGCLSLLKINLITGRTHQIRAQLAHIGNPIIGDSKYGDNRLNRKYRFKWQALQATGLDFSGATGEFSFCGKCFNIALDRFGQDFLNDQAYC